MTPFFRKIRKKMADDNKPLKYIRYAIGEIILVVIGILIALSINNWNQNRISKQDELQTIKSLLAELESNYTSFTQSYTFQVKRLNGVVQLLKIDASEHSFEYIDSLITIANYSFTYNPSLGLYNTTINSGKIENISNDSLKIKIAKFKDVIIDYQEQEQVVFDYSRNTLNQSMINNDLIAPELELLTGERLRTPEEKIIEKKVLITLFKDNKYRKIFLYLMLFLNDIYDEGSTVVTEFESLIIMMKKEINKLEN